MVSPIAGTLLNETRFISMRNHFLPSALPGLMGRRLLSRRRAQAGLVVLLVVAGGCSILSPSSGGVEAVPPVSPAPRLTEAGIIDALNRQWLIVNRLPAHLTIHAAPFEIAAQGLAGAKLRIKVWLRFTEDSFVPVRQVFSPAGKVITIVRQVYAQGQLVEIPLQVDDATIDLAGGVSLGDSFERSREAWGQPWNSFANAVDLATEKGARLTTAPQEIAEGERWLNEQRGRKADLDILMRALVTPERDSIWGSDKCDILNKHYPEARVKFSALKFTGDMTQFRQELLRWQREMEPIIRADFEKFDAKYLEVLRKVAAAKKLLADG